MIRLNIENEWDQTFFENKNFMIFYQTNEVKQTKKDLNMIIENVTQLFIEKIMQRHLATDFY